MKEIYDRLFGSLDIEPLLLLRTPMYPYNHWKHSLSNMLNDDTFIAALKNASPDLCETVVKNRNNVDAIPLQALISLKKYHNRICHRTTPFGLFAGFTAVDWTNFDSICITTQKCYNIYTRVEFGKTVFTDNIHQDSFVVNPTLYKVGSTLRFFAPEEWSNKSKARYSVQSVPIEEWLVNLLDYCKSPTSYASIKDFIIGKELAEETNVDKAIVRLLETYILLPSSFPHITETSISTTPMHMGKFPLDAFVDNCGKFPLHELYINTEKPLIAGGLSTKFKQYLLDGLLVGSLVSDAQSPTDLVAFRKAYGKKFEKRVMPLLSALDPDTGVGYGGLYQGGNTSVLIEGIVLKNESSDDMEIGYGKMQRVILDKWMNTENKQELILEDSDLQYDRDAATFSDGIPTGLSFMFKILNDGKLYIQNAGGGNPVGLVGRFTLFDEKIACFARDLAEKEASHNPEVVFADIVHFSGNHTANIESRKCSRKYEIQLLCNSDKVEKHRIPVSDLWVGIIDDEVVIWSHRLKQRVIPRMDSAYNHTTSDMPVLRFLCDLQYQNIKGNFSCPLQSLFPGLSHYPRFVYKNTVLSLEEWHIPKNEWVHRVIGSSIQELAQYITEKGLPAHFAITQNDRQLVVYRDCEDDLMLLKSIFKSKIPDYVNVQEFPFVGEDNGHCVRDTDGNRFVGEYVAVLSNRGQVYSGRMLLDDGPFFNLKRRNGIVDGWVYYKIFCNENSANGIISDYIAPLTTHLGKEAAIRRWFFVRYSEDGAYHLRLRFLVVDGHSQYVIHQMESCFCGLLDSGIVSNISLYVYERELERYGDDMETAERLFCAGSCLVASFLNKTELTDSDPHYYTLAFHSIDRILSSLGLEVEEKCRFHQDAYNTFRLEQGFPANIYRAMQEKIRKFRMHGDLFGDNLITESLQECFADFTKELTVLRFDGKNNNVLAGSLVHMHLNRFFVSEFRFQEMVVHYLLWKHYESQLARKSKVQCTDKL
ncbi:MAG: thiopeptide-type bacteriocin biosynthesis protein [Chitinophagaceae bacterium]